MKWYIIAGMAGWVGYVLYKNKTTDATIAELKQDLLTMRNAVQNKLEASVGAAKLEPVNEIQGHSNFVGQPTDVDQLAGMGSNAVMVYSECHAFQPAGLKIIMK